MEQLNLQVEEMEMIAAPKAISWTETEPGSGEWTNGPKQK